MNFSKMFLDFSIPIDDNRLHIPSCSIMRADHPSNTKRGGTCLHWQGRIQNGFGTGQLVWDPKFLFQIIIKP